jgi:hypothetical protein
LAGKRLEDARLNAELYSVLDWQTKFKKVEITGVEKVAGEEAFAVSFDPLKGTPYKEYYSTRTFLLIKRSGFIPSSTSQQQIPFSVVFSDYRDIDGLKLPFRSVSSSLENGDLVSTVRSVKHNVPIEG